MRTGILGKIGVSVLVAVVLLIPIALVRGLVDERRSRRDEAVSEITSHWGASQTLTGPVLSIPYRVRLQDKDGAERCRLERVQLLPDRLHVEGRAGATERRRGIFAAVLYVAELELSGTFPPVDAEELGVAPADFLQKDASLSVAVSDPRGLRTPSSLTWDGAAVPFAPAAIPECVLPAGFHAPLPAPAPGAPHSFSFRIALQGSDVFSVSPVAGETTVSLRSPWRTPSFSGAFLPDTRRVGAEGFAAQWRVSQFARNVPQRFGTQEAGLDTIRAAMASSAFGVRFFTPVDVYAETTRALKYALVFIVLTFTVFFLFELLAGLRVHPLSYALVGCALGLFYLLLLALSEQTGFAIAYALSASAIALLVAAYSAAVLAARRRAALVGGLLAALYGYLYVLLRLEDQALLAGAAGLLAALASVMWLTRKVDWYEMGTTKPPRAAYPPPVG